MADKVASFEEYAQTLDVRCQPGQPARLVWTVQPDTPKTVYYQVRPDSGGGGTDRAGAAGGTVGGGRSSLGHCGDRAVTSDEGWRG